MTLKIKTLTYEEETQLLNYFINFHGSRIKFFKRLRDFTMVLFMLDAGLRVGELVGLIIDDVRFDNQPSKSTIIRAEIAKNHKERTIPMSARLHETLNSYILYYDSMFHDLPRPFLFSTAACNLPLSKRQVERIVKGHARAALHKKVWPHMLRHTFATKLMRLTNMRTVQALMGHSSIASTQIYMHPNESDLVSAINAL